MPEFRFGDIVASKPGLLRSGNSLYYAAIVISEEPLMLCSHSTDMLWSSTVNDMQLEVVGRASAHQLKACMKRLPKK